MRSILKASAILSGGWAVSLVLGVFSAKVTAVVLGPEGVGFLGLLQSTLGLATLTLVGVLTPMVQTVSRVRAAADTRSEASVRLAAWWLSSVIGIGAAVVMIIARVPIARTLLGGETRAYAVWPLAAAVAIVLVASVQSGLLTAHGRIRELAKIGVSNSTIAPAMLILFVWLWHDRALPWAVLGGALASFAASRYYLQHVPGPEVAVTAREVWVSVRALVSLGLPLNIGALAGTGAQLALPMLVLDQLGNSAVGMYRSAAGVSQMYLAFLTPVLGLEYYPRTAASGDDPARLAATLNQQLRIVLMIAGPLVLAVLALVPEIIPRLYTPEFSPAIDVLEWQLTGDVLRVMTWTMTFAVLAHSGATVTLWAGVGNAAIVLISSLIGLRLYGLEGLGIALMICSAIGCALHLVILRKTIGFSLSRTNAVIAGRLLLGAVAIRVLALLDLDLLRIGVGLALTAAGAWAAWHMVRTEGSITGVAAPLDGL